MRDAALLDAEGIELLLGEKYDTEKKLVKRRDVLESRIQDLTDYNKFYISYMSQVFRNMGCEGRLQFPRKAAQITSGFSYEMLDCFFQTHDTDSVPALHRQLTNAQIDHLSSHYGRYMVETALLRNTIDSLAVKYAATYFRLIDQTLYARLVLVPNADKAILYVTFPHDPLMKRVEHDLWMNQTGEYRTSSVRSRKPGRLTKWRLVRKGKQNKADVYLIHNQSLCAEGPDVLAHAIISLQADYDSRRPDMAFHRGALRKAVEAAPAVLTREAVINQLFTRLIENTEDPHEKEVIKAVYNWRRNYTGKS